jgi:hypothetical protein
MQHTQGTAMYQLKYQGGWEIVVSGPMCEVNDRNGITHKTGTMDECEQWLAARGITSKY